MLPLSESMNCSKREKSCEAAVISRSSCYACIVAKHFVQKIILHLQVLSNSRTGVNFLRQHHVSSKSLKKPRNVLRECWQLLGEVFHTAKASQTQSLFPFWGPSTWQRCLESSTTTCLNQQLTKIMFLGW